MLHVLRISRNDLAVITGIAIKIAIKHRAKLVKVIDVLIRFISVLNP